MLGSLVLVGCAFAGLAAIAIVFVLYGPVPVNRRVTRLSRLAPARPFVTTVSVPAPILAAHPMFSPVEAFTTREPDFDIPTLRPMIADGTPTPVSASVQKRRAAAAAEPVAPLRLRRPGSPPPMPRSRAARGTENRRKEASFEVEHTALETSPFAQPTATFVYEDATFEEGTRVRRR